MNHLVPFRPSSATVQHHKPVAIVADGLSQSIFNQTRIAYRLDKGPSVPAIYVREQRARSGAYGRVYYCQQTNENWLWIVGADLRPFKLCRVS